MVAAQSIDKLISMYSMSERLNGPDKKAYTLEIGELLESKGFKKAEMFSLYYKEDAGGYLLIDPSLGNARLWTLSPDDLEQDAVAASKQDMESLEKLAYQLKHHPGWTGAGVGFLAGLAANAILITSYLFAPQTPKLDLMENILYIAPVIMAVTTAIGAFFGSQYGRGHAIGRLEFDDDTIQAGLRYVSRERQPSISGIDALNYIKDHNL